MVVNETNAVIASELEKGVVRGVEALLRAREEVEEYVCKHPKLLLSLTPTPLKVDMPETVRKMVVASKLAGVGPMAAVAGAIADVARREMEKAGAQICLVENGGEISLVNRSNKPVYVGLFTGFSGVLPFKLGFKIKPQSKPLGISTSSATYGRGVSFGVADAVTVFASNSAVADAFSTFICNETRRSDEELKSLIRKTLEFSEVFGVFVVKGKKVFLAGDVPELVKVDKDSLFSLTSEVI